MKNFLFLSLFLFSNISFSQNTDTLDEKFGYKELRFDSNLNTFSNLRFLVSDDTTIVYEYNPTDKSLYEIFSLNFNNIILIFDKSTEKLAHIILRKNYKSADGVGLLKEVNGDFKYLKSKYSELLGNSESLVKNDITLCWSGKKVLLTNSLILEDMKVDDMANVIYKMAIEVKFYRLDPNKKTTGF